MSSFGSESTNIRHVKVMRASSCMLSTCGSTARRGTFAYKTDRWQQ